jgi:hypothetical protein
MFTPQPSCAAHIRFRGFGIQVRRRVSTKRPTQRTCARVDAHKSITLIISANA